MNTVLLLSFCRESTEYVERNRLAYYWQAGEFKFHNKLLVSWYEKTYNTWASYITPVAQVRAGLCNPQSELDFVRSFEGKKTRLLLSGGSDSVTILDRFQEAGVAITQPWVYIETVDGINSDDVNEEQMTNGLPLLDRYGLLDRTHVENFNNAYYLKLYEDPWMRLRTPKGDRFYNFLIDQYDGILDPNDGYINIVGSEKPTVVYLHGRWYATFMDSTLDSRVSVPNPVYWWLDSRNIATWVNDARTVRDAVFVDCVTKDTVFKVFASSSTNAKDAEQFNDLIGRSKLIRPVYLGKGFHGKFYSMREMRYMSKLIYAQQGELMIKYYATISAAMSVFPDLNYGEQVADSKFGFLIDIDSLDVYTQEELMTERLTLS